MLCSAVDSSGSGVHRTGRHLTPPQQYNSHARRLLGRTGCRAKPTSSERTLEIAAARKQVKQSDRVLGIRPKLLQQQKDCMQSRPVRLALNRKDARTEAFLQSDNIQGVPKKTDAKFYFWDNFGNSAPILTIFSLLQADIYGA